MVIQMSISNLFKYTAYMLPSIVPREMVFWENVVFRTAEKKIKLKNMKNVFTPLSFSSSEVIRRGEYLKRWRMNNRNKSDIPYAKPGAHTFQVLTAAENIPYRNSAADNNFVHSRVMVASLLCGRWLSSGTKSTRTSHGRKNKVF